MSDYISLIALSELPEGSALELEYEGHVIALFHVDGQIYAMDGLCPHQAGPLADGEVAHGHVTCPWHGWRFNLKTGDVDHTKKVKHPVYPTKVVDGTIWVQLNPTASSTP